MKLFMILALVWLSNFDGASIWGFISRTLGSRDDNSDIPIQASEDVSQECIHYAQSGSFEFYDCLERRFPCGENKYIAKIGKHFSRKVASHIHLFTPAGKKYMNAINICLTSRYIDLYRGNNVTCNMMQDVGVSGLISCQNISTIEYPSYCQFVGDNTIAYWKIFDSADMLKILSLNEPRVWRLLIENVVSCGTDRLQRGVQRAFQRLKSVWDNILR
ncbi:hypothetical protein ACJMK2_033076 [Sinanodonta woodiana]|uniref:Uncharacterized protein n=1 Tax=Sinanodonta woodiana TaxID=1069815 RepID=A0ABD3X7J6_SINWO